MSRLLTPFLLGTAAFGIAWWAGSSHSAAPADGSLSADSPATTASATALPLPPPPPGGSLTGLARCSAQLLRTENPAVRDIAALVGEPGLDSLEVVRLAQRWADSDPAGMWKWLQLDGKEILSVFDPTNKVFESWFRLDPATAMAEMRRAAPEKRFMAAQGILANLTGKDTAARDKLIPLLDEVVEASQQGLFFFHQTRRNGGDPGRSASRQSERHPDGRAGKIMDRVGLEIRHRMGGDSGGTPENQNPGNHGRGGVPR